MGTFTRLTYHIVFGTKFRHPLIHPDLRQDLYDYIGGTVRGMNGHTIEIGGTSDHIHILTAIPPTIALSNVVRDIKANSSKLTNERPSTNSRFEWQRGYAAFTVSFSHIDAVADYIRRQEEHHKRKTFKEEYVEFLQRHQIPFEEKYLFGGEYVG